MKLLTAKETAEVLRVRPQWVYRMVRQGVLPGVRLGRQLRVDEDALKTWLAERGLSEQPEQNGLGRGISRSTTDRPVPSERALSDDIPLERQGRTA